MAKKFLDILKDAAPNKKLVEDIADTQVDPTNPQPSPDQQANNPVANSAAAATMQAQKATSAQAQAMINFHQSEIAKWNKMLNQKPTPGQVAPVAPGQVNTAPTAPAATTT